MNTNLSPSSPPLPPPPPSTTTQRIANAYQIEQDNLSSIIVSKIPTIAVYESLDQSAIRNQFQVGDGVMFWHFNKWQPMYGCCKILSIRQATEETIIVIGSKDNIDICELNENRVCWYPNFTNNNIQLLQNLHIDSSQKLSREHSKWNGRKLCISHSRSYFPHDMHTNTQFINSNSNSTSNFNTKTICCNRETLYSIDASPFLSSQSLTDLENVSADLAWHFPPAYIKWTCELTNRNFAKDFPKQNRFLSNSAFKLDFGPKRDENVIEMNEDSNDDDDEEEEETTILTGDSKVCDSDFFCSDISESDLEKLRQQEKDFEISKI